MRFGAVTIRCFSAGTLILALAPIGCGEPGEEGVDVEVAPASIRSETSPDPDLEVHVVEPSTPTRAGLEYLEALGEVHAEADRLIDSGDRRAAVETLADGLARPIPAGLSEAEVLRLDLAARLADLELRVGSEEAAARARATLEPLLTPTSRSLPLDAVTARALVVLGDAARKAGDDALAAGSYARALRMMSMLRSELEEEMR